MTFGVALSLFTLDRLDGSDVSVAEAIGLVTKTPLGPACYLLLILSMIRPSWRRMRALGLAGWWGLAVPFLLFADIPYLMATHSSSVLGSSIGAPDGSIPLYMMMALGLIAAMTFVRAPAEDERPFVRFGLAGKGAVLTFIFVFFFVIQFVGMAKWMKYLEPRLEAGDSPIGPFLVIVKNSYWLLVLNRYACFAFVALLAWCVAESRKRTGSA